MNGLLFITHQTEKYSYLQSVKIALNGGCWQIQLRMKEAQPSKVEEIALQARKMCDEYHAKLFIDDHVDVCLNTGAAGVHLGKLDMSPRKAREILGRDFIIGGTANTFDDVKRLKDEGVDYIGLGPFRFTTTKKNLAPIIGLAGYSEIMKQCREQEINLPVFAIGGIVKADICELMKTGVSGIALSSTILNAPNPIEETENIISIINLSHEEINNIRERI